MIWRPNPELSALRRHLRRARGRRRAHPALATRARGLAEDLAQFVGPLSCCASCARHTDPPHGRYGGGFCCGGSTDDLFRDAELEALALAGVKPRQLRAAPCEQAGCLFRGPTGCHLPVSRRPIVCLRHFCSEAKRELHSKGQLDEVEQRLAALGEAFDQWISARR